MSNNPLVSICLPTYNGALYLTEALNSAISQTYDNLEIVISDDASSDNTLEIVEAFKEKTSIPIHVFHHEPQGIGANWNHCVKHAKGDFIKFLFQDDVLFPTCISRMVAIAQDDPNVGLVYCRREIICETENEFVLKWMKNFQVLHTYYHDLKVNEGSISGKHYLKDKFFLDKPLNKIGEPPAVLLRKECFVKVGYFNTKLKQALDFEYWYRLMPFFNVGFVNEPLIQFRLHDNQASQLNAQKKNYDKKLLPRLLLKNIYKYLHPEQKKALLTKVLNLHFPILMRNYRRVKRRMGFN